jgi:hypothetical protein
VLNPHKIFFDWNQNFCLLILTQNCIGILRIQRKRELYLPITGKKKKKNPTTTLNMKQWAVKEPFFSRHFGKKFFKAWKWRTNWISKLIYCHVYNFDHLIYVYVYVYVYKFFHIGDLIYLWNQVKMYVL